MVACDGCGDWFHDDGALLLPRFDGDWLAPRARRRQRGHRASACCLARRAGGASRALEDRAGGRPTARTSRREASWARGSAPQPRARARPRTRRRPSSQRSVVDAVDEAAADDDAGPPSAPSASPKRCRQRPGPPRTLRPRARRHAAGDRLRIRRRGRRRRRRSRLLPAGRRGRRLGRRRHGGPRAAAEAPQAQAAG